VVSHLVLGCGTVGHTLVGALADREGELRVLETDQSRVETLRNERVDATAGDVTDAATVGAVGPAELVVVAGDDPGVNRAAAEAARAAYPDAHLIAYVGEDATPADRAALAGSADRVVDPGVALLDWIESAFVDDALARARDLRAVLAGVDGELGVFAHDNPDPDALASAVALGAVAETAGVEATVYYYGEIAHQENRAFVNLLDIEVESLADGDPGDYDAVALVDHSRPGVNNQLPPDTPVDIVIDHHPSEEAVEARFVDVRAAAGATSTLLTDYVRQFDLDPTGQVATALLYGIQVDTKDFRREVTTADFEAAAYLRPHADVSVLKRIESPSVSAETLDAVADAIEGRRIEGSALASVVGSVGDRDALAQAADRLLAMEGITATMVAGYTDGTIYVSARSRGTERDLGAVLRRAFEDIGSAGGHTDMAGAQIPLGLFEGVRDGVELDELLRERVVERFFAALRNDEARIEAIDPEGGADGAETGDDPNSERP
jgi:nanoRNase/pAp phosphatase (c-di-AMP/oligoRNAs hydrolase)